MLKLKVVIMSSIIADLLRAELIFKVAAVIELLPLFIEFMFFEVLEELLELITSDPGTFTLCLSNIDLWLYLGPGLGCILPEARSSSCTSLDSLWDWRA